MYKFITGFVALGLASCAAYFSVIGIASLMGANFWQVAVMAGFLEAGKLVSASAAYRFRKVAPRWIRGLFITFTAVMMLITSLGIFGFLSSSYQEAASERDISQQKVQNLESKRETFKSEVERLKQDRQRLISEQQELQSTRSEQGWLSERQDERLSRIPSDLAETDSALTAARDSVLSLDTRVTELQSSQNEEAKLGPIIFVANTIGIPENSAALYFIGLLMLVFDPMAVTLVVALSMATDLEETVTEEEETEDEDPAATEEFAEPKPGSGKNVMKKDPIGKAVEIKEVPNGLAEAESDPESADQTEQDHSPDEEEKALQKEDEETESRNKAKEQVVEEDPHYPEKPPELEVSGELSDQTTEQEDDFEKWAKGGEESVRDKPWKSAFKKPYN